jgi:UDP-N-acetylglucosamine diphosphorylase/glucosamine-1-phosphate N-acetyltransferase
MKNKVKAIILAAGRGKRLRESESDMLPKVMKTANGVPLLGYVLEAVSFIPDGDITVVVGFGREYVTDYCAGKYNIAVQEAQLGTGNAVDVCRASLAGYSGSLLVCYGDTPLVSRSTYEGLIEYHSSGNYACTVLTVDAENPYGYGRIIRGENGGFAEVAEERDCTEAQRKVREINSGLYVFDSAKLFGALTLVTRDNSQNEYYLTDVPKILKNNGETIGIYKIADEWQTLGINTAAQLEEAERLIRDKGIIPT